MTQTSHYIKLIQNSEQMESGFLPRFLTFQLSPVYNSNLDELTESDPNFLNKLMETLQLIKAAHIGCLQKEVIKYRLYRKTLAYKYFKSYIKGVTEWLQENHYKLELQNTVTVISKSKGQILRLAAILNAMYLFHDADDVTAHEANNSINNESQYFVEYISNNEDPNSTDAGIIPISLMAMQSSIALVTYALSQNLVLQGVTSVTIVNNPDGSITFQNALQPNSNNTQQSTPISLSSSSSVVRFRKVTMTNLGKAVTLGGNSLSLHKMVQNKKFGREGESTNAHVISVFNELATEGFGEMINEDMFVFYEDVIDKVKSSDSMKRCLTMAGVSIPKFMNSIQKEVQPKKQKVNPLNDITNSN